MYNCVLSYYQIIIKLCFVDNIQIIRIAGKGKRTDESVEEQAKDLARSTETHKSGKLKIFPCHETIK